MNAVKLAGLEPASVFGFFEKLCKIATAKIFSVCRRFNSCKNNFLVARIRKHRKLFYNIVEISRTNLTSDARNYAIGALVFASVNYFYKSSRALRVGYAHPIVFGKF